MVGSTGAPPDNVVSQPGPVLDKGGKVTEVATKTVLQLKEELTCRQTTYNKNKWGGGQERDGQGD